MKSRDLAIVAAVLLLGGIALADALRSDADESSEPRTQTIPDGRERGPQPDAPEGWPAGRLRGTLVFTDTEDCRVRVIGLGGGRERPTGDLVGFCDLWAAPIGQRIAYSTGGVRGSTGQSFAVVDLRRAGVELATFQHLAGDVLWSPDAQRIAWCDVELNGFELDIGEERPRSLESCPVAYDPEGHLAFPVGTRLVSGGVTVVKEKEPIAQAHWGVDGSVLTVLPSGTVRRHDLSGDISSINLAGVGNVTPSLDNCALLVKEPGFVQVADVGCFSGNAPSFIAFDAAWSPDGQWVAVAAVNRIEFHRVVGGDETVNWPALASELYWRGD